MLTAVISFCPLFSRSGPGRGKGEGKMSNATGRVMGLGLRRGRGWGEYQAVSGPVSLEMMEETGKSLRLPPTTGTVCRAGTG